MTYLAEAQAAKAAEVLDKRWREREKGHIQETGATSLPPTWFALRQPDGLQGPQGKLPRYRSAADSQTLELSIPMATLLIGKSIAMIAEIHLL